MQRATREYTQLKAHCFQVRLVRTIYQKNASNKLVSIVFFLLFVTKETLIFK